MEVICTSLPRTSFPDSGCGSCVTIPGETPGRGAPSTLTHSLESGLGNARRPMRKVFAMAGIIKNEVKQRRRLFLLRCLDSRVSRSSVLCLPWLCISPSTGPALSRHVQFRGQRNRLCKLLSNGKGLEW